MKTGNLFFLFILTIILLGSCSSTPKTDSQETRTIAKATPTITFNEDSAYSFVKAQCDFGPRVPNTKAHRQCGDYLIGKLTEYGANVITQETILTTFDRTKLNARNIIGEFAPEKKRRILLLAHWDCRPWADSDPDPANHKKAVMGANDGASGVGVLLELARLFHAQQPEIGVDILFVDAEDWGDNSGLSANADNSWALGTQYWIANPHRLGYRPIYAILLDMVGAKGSQFSQEYFSMQYAQAMVNEVWNMAHQSGYGNYFPKRTGGAITDDHVFINRAGIPAIDIIAMDPTSTNGFFPQWHTIDDTMTHIDPATLKAVGQTLTNLIYNY